jgi:hypothetical protein
MSKLQNEEAHSSNLNTSIVSLDQTASKIRFTLSIISQINLHNTNIINNLNLRVKSQRELTSISNNLGLQIESETKAYGHFRQFFRDARVTSRKIKRARRGTLNFQVNLGDTT